MHPNISDRRQSQQLRSGAAHRMRGIRPSSPVDPSNTTISSDAVRISSAYAAFHGGPAGASDPGGLADYHNRAANYASSRAQCNDASTVVTIDDDAETIRPTVTATASVSAPAYGQVGGNLRQMEVTATVTPTARCTIGGVTSACPSTLNSFTLTNPAFSFQAPSGYTRCTGSTTTGCAWRVVPGSESWQRGSGHRWTGRVTLEFYAATPRNATVSVRVTGSGRANVSDTTYRDVEVSVASTLLGGGSAAFSAAGLGGTTTTTRNVTVPLPNTSDSFAVVGPNSRS